MTNTAAHGRSSAGLVAAVNAGDDARGWYLYGITRSGPLAAELAGEIAGSGTDASFAAARRSIS